MTNVLSTINQIIAGTSKNGERKKEKKKERTVKRFKAKCSIML
jgi:hypothetical protein